MVDPAVAALRSRRRERRSHADRTGGVHGLLPAATVLIGADTGGSFPRVQVVAVLLSGVAFFFAHVHARPFGERVAEHLLDRRTVLHVCREERPIVKAAVPPAVAVAVSPLPGLDVSGTLWFALGVASTGPVAWSLAAARRAGASGRMLVLTAVVNLLLRLLIISVKLFVKLRPSAGRDGAGSPRRGEARPRPMTQHRRQGRCAPVPAGRGRTDPCATRSASRGTCRTRWPRPSPSWATS